jgi:hypothetical protein
VTFGQPLSRTLFSPVAVGRQQQDALKSVGLVRGLGVTGVFRLG